MPYLRPGSVDEALDLLRDRRPRIVAGGTDLFPAERPGDRLRDLIDIARLPGLRGIVQGPGGWRIGAATTWAEIARAPLPPAFDALRQAARQVGAVQIQNVGTLAGNLCNASPAADGVPPLLALDAAVEIGFAGGWRRLPLAEFVTGPRRTALAPGEMVTALHVPHPPEGAQGAFLKLGGRAALAISIVMVAAVVRSEAGRIAEARVAVGACAPVARRLPGYEAHLRGRALADPAGLVPDPAHLAPLEPIGDPRGSASYRLHAAAELCRRAVLAAAGGGDGR